MSKEYIVLDLNFPNMVKIITDGLSGLGPRYFDAEPEADKYGNENTDKGYIVALVVHKETASE